MDTGNPNSAQKLIDLMARLPQEPWQSFFDGVGNLCIGCGDTPIAFVPPGPLQRQIADFLCACAPAQLAAHLKADGIDREAVDRQLDDYGYPRARSAPAQCTPCEVEPVSHVQPDLSDAGMSIFLRQLDGRVVAALQAREQDELAAGQYTPSAAESFDGSVQLDNWDFIRDFIRHLAALSPAQCLASCLGLEQDNRHATANMLPDAHMLHCLGLSGPGGLVVQRFQYLRRAGVIELLWDAEAAQIINRVLRILNGEPVDEQADEVQGSKDAVSAETSIQQIGSPVMDSPDAQERAFLDEFVTMLATPAGEAFSPQAKEQMATDAGAVGQLVEDVLTTLHPDAQAQQPSGEHGGAYRTRWPF